LDSVQKTAIDPRFLESRMREQDQHAKSHLALQSDSIR
jgi:hypothetical protein